MKPTASTMKILNHWVKKLKKTLECRKPSHTNGSELMMWKWLSYKNQSVDPILQNPRAIPHKQKKKSPAWYGSTKIKHRANALTQNENCWRYHETLFPALKNYGHKSGMLPIQKHILRSYGVPKYQEVPKFW